MPDREGPTALYRFFGEDGTLLYIGISADLGYRWTQHSRKRPWWVDVRTATVEHFDSRSAAASAELMAIRAERPQWNSAGLVRHPRPDPVAVGPADTLVATSEPWPRVGEVAVLVAHERKTVSRWVRSGKWKPRFRVSVGGHRRYHPDDVRALVAEVRRYHGGDNPAPAPGSEREPGSDE